MEEEERMEQDMDYSKEEEEEEEYSEHFWDELDLDDIRDCIRDIYGLPDDMVTETTTDDQ